jgi:hypothetical protein
MQIPICKRDREIDKLEFSEQLQKKVNQKISRPLSIQ